MRHEQRPCATTAITVCGACERMRGVIALLFVSFLAGCAGVEEAPNDVEPGTIDEPVAGNETTEPVVENVTNVAPTALLNATTDGFNATFVVSVDDADGDNVTWQLDADGDGVLDANGTESGNVTFTYAAAGTFNATLTASDGVNETITNMTIVIEEAISYLPGEEISVSWTGGSVAPGCLGDIFGVPYVSALDGVTFKSFPLAEHTIGYPYTATISSTGLAGGDVGLAFLDADFSAISSGFISSTGEGEIPEGAAYGVMWSCYYVGNSGTFTSTPPA